MQILAFGNQGGICGLMSKKERVHHHMDIDKCDDFFQ